MDIRKVINRQRSSKKNWAHICARSGKAVNVNSALMLHFNAAFTIMQQQQSSNVGGDPPSPPLLTF